MSMKEKELKMSKCQTDRAKSISMLWSGIKIKNPIASKEIKKISLKLDNHSKQFKRSESVPYITNANLSAIPLKKNSSKEIREFTSNHDNIQAIFNNKYYSNEVKTKFYVLPNNAVIKDRFIQKSLIGDDPKYYHMKKMVRFWDCFCNYVCPKITIGKLIALKKSSEDDTKNNCIYYHSPHNKKPIKLTKLPVLYTNSSSAKKKRIKKIPELKQVYSNIEIKRVLMDNELSYKSNYRKSK